MNCCGAPAGIIRHDGSVSYAALCPGDSGGGLFAGRALVGINSYVLGERQGGETQSHWTSLASGKGYEIMISTLAIRNSCKG